MDSLEDFEKHLAEEKKAREDKHRSDHRDRVSEHRRHKHHHRSSHRSGDARKKESDFHRSKRTKHEKDDHEEDSGKRTSKKFTNPHESRAIPQEDQNPDHGSTQTKRDAWMEAPSANEFNYIQKRPKKIVEASELKPDFDLKIHKNELNRQLHAQDTENNSTDSIETPADGPEYTFGDAGSQWRMTKLKTVYKKAEQSQRPLDEVAIEIFGDLEWLDDAREEQIELDRRKTYGEGYVEKQRPSGELFRQRKKDIDSSKDSLRPARNEETPLSEATEEKLDSTSQMPLDPTTLNRMKAQLMKAKLKNSPDVVRLEKEYNDAMASYTENSSKPDIIVLSHMESRLLAGTRGEVKNIDTKRGRERGLVEDNEEMSIEDMVREARRARGQAGGEGMRAAERIAKDAKFETDLDYMEENANKLAKRVQKSEINLKNIAISEYQKMNRILDNCQLCHHEDKNQPPVAPIVSLATRVYLALSTEPEISEGGAVIVPLQHRLNLLECDDDEWEEVRNFMKSLTRMYHDQGRDVMFYENAADPYRKRHASMQVIPLPYSLGKTAPAFFREAILSSDEEWTQHKKLLDTAAKARDGLGKHAFHRTFVKEMPYFHAWFEINGGLGHIIEDLKRWPKGDLFAREVIGGMLDVDPEIIRKQGRWNRNDMRLPSFRARWRKFDWTRVLTDA